MSVTKTRKQELIAKFGSNAEDTGSPRVQVALLTERINDLTKHFDKHKKDHHSRRGLLMMVGARRRLLKWIEAQDPAAYQSLIAELGLRK